MRTFRAAAVTLMVVLVLSACSGDDEGTEPITTQTPSSLATITTSESNPTTGSTVAGTATDDTTGESIVVGEATFPDYAIVQRTTGSAGDIVVVLLDPDSYDVLTDIDLQNVVADVVERFPPIAEAYVVDDETVAPLVLRDDLNDAELALVAEHHFVTLVDGFRIVFAGPFESSGDLILGS